MLYRRVIVCLDVDGGRVVKGVNFGGLQDAGDPVELAAWYEAEGADEIVFLDVSASVEGRATVRREVQRVAERLFIPLAVGGGIRSADDVAATLRAGADKVSINSAAVSRPEVIRECADRFGSQCVVASIDARREGDRWIVFTHGGRTATNLDAVAWARRCQDLGAGEILLTSIDRDGTRVGYDVELTAAVAEVVDIPVIASGGAGAPPHAAALLTATRADAVLVAGMLHDRTTTVAAIKMDMARRGVPVRALAHV
jgi:cyclase